VETLGIPWPMGEPGVLRSAARQAEILVDVVQRASQRMVPGDVLGGMSEGTAAARYAVAAETWRQDLAGAARAMWTAAQALLPLARALEEAQTRANGALEALRSAEVQRQRALGGSAASCPTGDREPAAMRPVDRAAAEEAEEAYQLARRRAERTCLDALDMARAADRAAALLIEQEALRAPVPAPEPPPPAPDRGGPGFFRSFVEGAWKGDFSDDHSGGALLGQVGIGFVPVLGQVADGRDIAAAIRNRDWEYLPLVALGIIPGLDFLKAVRLGRLERRAIAEARASGLGEVAEEGIERLSFARNLDPEVVTRIRDELLEIEMHRSVAIVRLERISTMKALPSALRERIAKAGRTLRDHAKPSDLVGALLD
ncbi:MAG: hypothetical protein ACRDJO_04635, partial [Actinomycetota bacterium]